MSSSSLSSSATLSLSRGRFLALRRAGSLATSTARSCTTIDSNNSNNQIDSNNPINQIDSIASTDSLSNNRKPPFNVITSLHARSLIADTTSGTALTHLLASTHTAVYAGFDPTAPSLHAGNLLAIVSLLHFYLAGHRVIALVGGATGSVGDPSGKSMERPMLDGDKVSTNTTAIEQQLDILFINATAYARSRYAMMQKTDDAPQTTTSSQKHDPDDLYQPIRVLNNRDWLGSINLLDFLATVGKTARVSAMLSRESVRARINTTGISFTEFTYQLLQAYDFWHLFAHFGCRVQIGGSDQWGNITAGTDLVRKFITTGNTNKKGVNNVGLRHPDAIAAAVNVSNPDCAGEHEFVHGLTIPLVTDAFGNKFGKSAGNAVWLDEQLLSVYDFYQFFRKISDTDVGKYLCHFTFLTDKRVHEILTHHKSHPGDQLPQRILAMEVTEMVHGADNAMKADTISRMIHGDDMCGLTACVMLDAVCGDARHVRVCRGDVVGNAVWDVANRVGATKSRSAGRKLMTMGGVYLNKTAIKDTARTFQETDLIDNRVCLLRIGKDKFVVIEVV